MIEQGTCEVCGNSNYCAGFCTEHFIAWVRENNLTETIDQALLIGAGKFQLCFGCDMVLVSFPTEFCSECAKERAEWNSLVNSLRDVEIVMGR